jgi:hypothetical protein
VIFLTGFIIERLKDEEMAHKGYYGFEIMHQDLASSSSGEHHRYKMKQRLIAALDLLANPLLSPLGVRTVLQTREARAVLQERGRARQVGHQPAARRARK